MRLDEVEGYAEEGRPRWHMIRSVLGIESFGINAWRATEAGQQIIGEHDELGSGAGGHEELYFVLSGRATFTVDGERVDAPAGSLVFVKDPATRRGAVADEAATEILVIGGRPGAAFSVSPWERSAEALRCWTTGDWDRAIEILDVQLAEDPANANVLYNLACAESRSGRSRRRDRAPDAGGGARAALRRAGADRRRPRRDSRRRPLSGAPADRLALDARRRPAAARPSARARKPGTTSCSGRATRSTAEWSGPASAETRSSSPTASANALCASSPPNGTSSSGRARPAITSPCVTAPIETSADERLAVARRDRDRERIRARQRRAARGGREPPRGGGGEDCHVPGGGDAARPVAERARREAPATRRRASPRRHPRGSRRRRSRPA